MATLGEIRVFAFNFAPLGWLPCEGQTLQVSDYQGLFAAIGNTYGGNAGQTFNLPDMRSRLMMNADPKNPQIKSIGLAGGAEAVALDSLTAASHSHSLNIASAPDALVAEGASIAQSVALQGDGTVLSFSDLASTGMLNTETLGSVGNGAAHENRMPSLALTVCIASDDQVAFTEMPLMGEIRPFAFTTCPSGWLVCDGSVHQIEKNEALASILGNTFGGDGETTFGLPDLRGRAVAGCGQGTGLSSYTFGQSFGSESVSLSIDEMPAHHHQVIVCNDTAVSATPQGIYTYLAARECPIGGSLSSFYPAGHDMKMQVLHPDTIGTSTGGPHENRQPYLAINYLICNNGFYPQKN